MIKWINCSLSFSLLSCIVYSYVVMNNVLMESVHKPLHVDMFISGSQGKCVFTFMDTVTFSLQIMCAVDILSSTVRGVQSFYTLACNKYLWAFNCKHSKKYEEESQALAFSISVNASTRS